MARGGGAVPLTEFQDAILRLIGEPLADDAYLAGGAAIHFTPNSARYSNDLDLFHDSLKQVASSFAIADALLKQAGYDVVVELSQPGFIRAIVRRGDHATLVDWAHDTAWRFLPLVVSPLGARLMHPVDLAINKVLALAGRDEPRDFVDILFIHEHTLPLGAMIWAATGKDPGFTPRSLLELLKRRGHYRPEEFARLDLARPFDLQQAKPQWLQALSDAEAFIATRPPEEVGCLYWDPHAERFVAPDPQQSVFVHFGTRGGVVPRTVA